MHLSHVSAVRTESRLELYRSIIQIFLDPDFKFDSKHMKNFIYL